MNQEQRDGLPAKFVGYSSIYGQFYTLLHLADATATEWLLDSGADPNARDSVGGTPLLYARSTTATQALLSAGADPDLSDCCGFTPLHAAKSKDQSEALLDAGTCVHAKDERGRGALMFARSLEQAELLLDRGATPEMEYSKILHILRNKPIERQAAFLASFLSSDNPALLEKVCERLAKL